MTEMPEPMRLRLPTTLDDGSALRFVGELEAHVKDEQRIVVDFSTIHFAHPFASLVLAVAVRDFYDRRQNAKLPSYYRSNVTGAGGSYLAQMGFFQAAGIPLGKQPGEARGGATYVPIRIIERRELGESDRGFYKEMEAQADDLAGILFRDTAALPGVSYSLFETIRNVFEHTDVPGCVVFAQRFPRNDDTAEIAVVDRGRGIRESLAEAFPSITDEEAIRAALLPGVTRSRETESQDPYQNSGFGLYVMSELARRLAGSFVLWSKGLRLKIWPDGREEVTSAFFPGTAVKVRLTPKNADVKKLLSEIINDGGSKARSRSRATRSKLGLA